MTGNHSTYSFAGRVLKGRFGACAADPGQPRRVAVGLQAGSRARVRYRSLSGRCRRAQSARHPSAAGTVGQRRPCAVSGHIADRTGGSIAYWVSGSTRTALTAAHIFPRPQLGLWSYGRGAPFAQSGGLISGGSLAATDRAIIRDCAVKLRETLARPGHLRPTE
jgi:hypothetical protein